MLDTAQDLDIDITNLDNGNNPDSLSSLIGVVDDSHSRSLTSPAPTKLTRPSNRSLLKLSSSFSILVLMLSVALTLMYPSTSVPVNSVNVLGVSSTTVSNSLDNAMLMTYITNTLESVALDKVLGIFFRL